MHRTRGSNNVNNLFTDGPPGTVVDADWLNAVQEEIAEVIEDAGYSLRDNVNDTRDQLNTAIGKKIDDAITATEVTNVRQTVLFGEVDSDGHANFLQENIADQIELAATSTPCKIAFAYGNTNYIYEVDNDVTPTEWQGLTDVGIYFLYADYDSVNEVISYGKTRVRPQYGQAFDITKNALLHFDGADTSTTMTDEYGNVWTAQGDAQLQTADKKFGSASLELDGAGDYVSNTTILSLGDRFCVECWWHTDNTGTNSQGIFSFTNAANYGLEVVYNNGGSGVLNFALSTNGSAWNIANYAVGTRAAWLADTWYHIRVEWDGANFYAYIDGVQDYTVALTNPICAITKVHLGAGGAPANYLDGGIDEFRMDIGCTREEEAFTPAVAAYSPDAEFFDISEMKFKYGAPGAWTEKKRVFLGETIMVANHVTSVVTYALRGYYDSGAFAVANNTTYTKNHNIGCDKIETTILSREHDGWAWEPLYALTTDGASNYHGAEQAYRYKTIMVIAGLTYITGRGSTDIEAAQAYLTGGFYKAIAKRSF